MIRNRIGDGCRKTYDTYNIRLILWLFDNEEYHEIIHPNLLPKLLRGHEADCSRRTFQGRTSKKHDYIRAAAKTALDNMEATDPSTHPILLDKMSLTIITNYFYTSYKKAFHKEEIGGEEVIVPGRGEDEASTIHVRLHISSYDGITSSLSCLFTDCKVARDVNEQVKHMWETLPLYKKGSSRKGAKERHQLGLRMNEGRDPIPFAAYVHLAEILCKSEKPEHIAARLFLLLDWNLMSSAETVVDSNIELVGMWSDALCFEIVPTKTDPEGKKNLDHPFHVYSVPENPAICPVLAMAKHLVNRPQILKGKCALFEGSNQ